MKIHSACQLLSCYRLAVTLRKTIKAQILLECLVVLLKFSKHKEIKGKTGEKQKIRGLLVAPSIGDDALELLEEEGIEFVAVEPPKELKQDKKVTLDTFF